MEEEEGLKENVEAEEVEKEVIEEKRVCTVDGSSLQNIEVYLKWEASKENPGKFITTLKVVKDASLADLRKLIAIYLGADNQAFIFLMLGDPTGASVPKEKEATIQVTKLPLCNNKSNGYLASLRPLKGMQSPKRKPGRSGHLLHKNCVSGSLSCSCKRFSGKGRCSCTSLLLNRSISNSFSLQQQESRAACVLQTAWRRYKREKLQKSPRLAKEGSLSATDHHAVSETQHK
ncbi:unnamed protein product [Prunus armeniaca]